ncbi:unnamed protein product [Adineta ricciae]|uniref:Uncharacterized protein n=1 Tax=Adineta ricciae TaxID=249248 RepID=A0A813P1R5_ADIRI|nr:unnamed protein product [Adineta ricciae]
MVKNLCSTGKHYQSTIFDIKAEIDVCSWLIDYYHSNKQANKSITSSVGKTPDNYDIQIRFFSIRNYFPIRLANANETNHGG